MITTETCSTSIPDQRKQQMPRFCSRISLLWPDLCVFWSEPPTDTQTAAPWSPQTEGRFNSQSQTLKQHKKQQQPQNPHVQLEINLLHEILLGYFDIEAIQLSAQRIPPARLMKNSLNCSESPQDPHLSGAEAEDRNAVCKPPSNVNKALLCPSAQLCLALPLAHTLVVTSTFSLPSRKRSITAALCSTIISPLSSATWWPSFESSAASQPAVFRV